MVSQHERLRLMHAYEADSGGVSSAAVLKCAAGLSIVAALAAIGVTGETGDQTIATARFFHSWQLMSQQALRQEANAAAQTQPAADLNARKSSLERPAGALANPVQN